MKKKDAESINGTLDMLKRLAYSVHGVMDIVDYNNIKVAKQTMDKLADGYKICNVDNAMQIINSRDWLTNEAKLVIGEIIKEACEE